MRSVNHVSTEQFDSLRRLSVRRVAAGISLVSVSALFVLALSSDIARATTEAVVAQATFVAPITIVENESLRFGLLDVAMANAETVIIGTDDSTTDAGSNTLSGAATRGAADLTVTSTAAQAISILVDNISGGTYHNLGTFLCSYAGGGDTVCDSTYNIASSSASTTLLIGATLTGLGSAVAGADNGSFDVNVIYQ